MTHGYCLISDSTLNLKCKYRKYFCEAEIASVKQKISLTNVKKILLPLCNSSSLTYVHWLGKQGSIQEKFDFPSVSAVILSFKTNNYTDALLVLLLQGVDVPCFKVQYYL